MMKTSILALSLLAVLWQGAAVAAEQELLLSEGVRNRVEATVSAVDLRNRNVTLNLADGQQLNFSNVDPRISRFENLAVGDKVMVAAGESLAISLSKGTAGVRRIELSEAEDVLPNGAGVLKTRATYNDIIAIDKTNGVVRAKNPDGKIVDIPVQNQEYLNKAAVGDQIVVLVRASATIWGNDTQ